MNKFLTFVAIVILGAVAYSVCTDDYGHFDTPVGLDHAMYRMGRDLRGGANSAESSIQETNAEMQGVHNGRVRRNDRKIARDSQGK